LRERSRVAYWARVVAVNLLVLAGALFVAELAYRALSTSGEFYRRTYPGQDSLHFPQWARRDDKVGWVFNGAGAHTFKSSNRPWSVTVNDEGFRSRDSYRDRPRESQAKRVMLLGDSFVFGTYLNDSETLSSALQQTLGPGYHVDNFGVPGWGIDQMLLAYLAYVDTIDPDFVIAVYIDDDVLRVFEAFRGWEGMGKPSFEVVDGQLVRRTRDDPGFIDRMAEVSILANRFYKYVYRPHVSGRIARALFLELASETRKRGQALLVVRYPSRSEILENQSPSFDFAGFCRDERISYLDPREAMKAEGLDRYRTFYLDDDTHPSPEGNRFVAEAIAESAFRSH
jgi:hypothetical protein